MRRARFLYVACFAVSLLFISARVNGQNTPPEKVAGESKNGAVQNDAARAAGTSAAVPAPTESAAPPENDAKAPKQPVVPQLQIGPGDLLSISVYGVPEMSQDTRVGNNGDIYLPLIGYVQVGGLSPDQAQSVIENRLREGEFVKNPHVSVFMKDFVNASVSVTGEVSRPGVYPILGTRRLLDVIAAAGGVTGRAGRTVYITHRDDPDHPVKVLMASDPAQSLDSNVIILPGDTLVVAKAGIIYVVGEVGRPSGLVMENNESMTVLQAIALAGGTTSVAALNGARVIRKTDTGREELRLPLKKILANKAPDMALKADDIIFVPGSTGKKAAKRGMDSIVAITTSLAIYHP